MPPVWISHRGYHVNATENTAEAFRAAVKLGFTHLETDLRLSADGHIVLAHDPDLKRIAGDPRFIAELTRAELEKVTLFSGERLLFLDDFLHEFAAYNWIFDIKPEAGDKTVAALITWIKSRNFSDWISAQAKFVFWNIGHEFLLKSSWPTAQCYAQEKECWRAGLAALCRVPFLGGIKKGRIYALLPSLGPISLYTPEIVESFHKAGAYVIAFLPETKQHLRQALSAGVDEILTNGQMFSKGVL